MNEYVDLIRAHYVEVWGNVPVEREFDRGPVHELPLDFRVLEFAPGRRTFWTYATCGMSRPQDEQPVELHLFSPHKYEGHVERLTMVAHYHRTGSRIDLAHTLNFGKPWMEGSDLGYGLISLPYLDGPGLENLETSDGTVKFYWLIPITKAERDFATMYGLNALEKAFEKSSFNYLDPRRKSVA